MNTVTDTDTVVLEGLDFQPPCDIVRPSTREVCGATAEWIVVWKGHCSGAVATRLMCAAHHDSLTSGELWRCPTCRALNDARPLVISTERIGA